MGMATCKDCLHYSVCDYVSILGKTCKDFKDHTMYVEVVHGQWIYEEEPDENNNVEAHCSMCFAGDLHATALMNKVPYCWKCGAKMDGGN